SLTAFTLGSSRLPAPTLFPYTPLFRSRPDSHALHLLRGCLLGRQRQTDAGSEGRGEHERQYHQDGTATVGEPQRSRRGRWRGRRSEEHTSELQSRFDLVCRLLLEKKKS